MAGVAIRNATKAELAGGETARPPSLAAVHVADAARRIVSIANQNDQQAASLAPILNAVAAAAETEAIGLDALLSALERPEMLAQLPVAGPLTRARLRGIRARQRLLEAEGGAVSGQEFADLVGVSRQAIDKRRRHGTVIGLWLGKKGYFYPVWQADLDGLQHVLAELREYEPWTQAIFMLTANSALGGETPLSLLRRGERQAVIGAARQYGEQTASGIVPASVSDVPDA